MKINNTIKLCSAWLCISTSFIASSHAGHGSTAPWQACEKKEQHQHCTYTTQHKRALGTCQTMNNVLMCVRNTPLEDIIEKATDKPADKLIEKIK